MDAAPPAQMPLPSAQASTPCPVGDVMRRVQAQLRSGRAPSFEALLALGAPAQGPGLG